MFAAHWEDPCTQTRAEGDADEERALHLPHRV